MPWMFYLILKGLSVFKKLSLKTGKCLWIVQKHRIPIFHLSSVNLSNNSDKNKQNMSFDAAQLHTFASIIIIKS
jgi:hypothetical protein